MTTIEKACLGKTANSVCRRSVATRFEESIPVIIVSSTDRLADQKKKINRLYASDTLFYTEMAPDKHVNRDY